MQVPSVSAQVNQIIRLGLRDYFVGAALKYLSVHKLTPTGLEYLHSKNSVNINSIATIHAGKYLVTAGIQQGIIIYDLSDEFLITEHKTLE